MEPNAKTPVLLLFGTGALSVPVVVVTGLVLLLKRWAASAAAAPARWIPSSRYVRYRSISHRQMNSRGSEGASHGGCGWPDVPRRMQ